MKPRLKTKNFAFSLIPLLFAAIFVVSSAPAAAQTPENPAVRLVFGNGAARTRPLTADVDSALFPESFVLRVSKEELAQNGGKLEVFADFSEAPSGADGFFVFSNGMLTTFKDRAKNTEHALGSNYNFMPVWAASTPGGSYVAIVESATFEYASVARYRDGKYAFFPRFQFATPEPYEDVAIRYFFLPAEKATYSEAAKTYRRYQLERGACQTLKEKIKTRPELKYAAESIEVRIRQGWKPAPSPVPEQTLETEPPMHVAATFERVGEILDEFKKQGIDKAEICLVGWNQKGHDGRYPQIFPVEESLGGEAELKKLIEKAEKLGFQIVAHTNCSDAYRIADSWDEEFIVKKKDGTLSKNASWSGGQMYDVCPARAFDVAVSEKYPAVAALGFRGLHYIDVVSIVEPRTCFDPRHPRNSRQSAADINEILAYTSGLFGGVASEGAFDFCAAHLDYVLYVSFNLLGKKPEIVDRNVPFWQLVYHGTILHNPSAETCNYTIKDAKTALKFVEYGGRPAFYFHSKFKDGAAWMGEEDITCETDAALEKSVAAVKKGYDEFQRLAALQLETMDEHAQIDDDVFKTVFSNGTAIISNYRADEYEYFGRKIAPLSYIVVENDAR